MEENAAIHANKKNTNGGLLTMHKVSLRTSCTPDKMSCFG